MRARNMAIAEWIALGFALFASDRVRADLDFQHPIMDLGEIRTGQALEHRFTFTNNGRSTVRIVETKASCGCLNPELDTQVLKPGEKGAMLLKVHTLSAPVGKHLWQVQVKYETLGAPREAVLQLHAHVLQEIAVQPPALIIYGGPIEHEITVTDLRRDRLGDPLDAALGIRGVETTSPHLKSRVVESARNGQGHRVHKLKLAVLESLPPGRHDDQVVIHTDDERYRELRVPVSVIKKAKQRYAASPTNVSVVASRLQPAPSRQISIRDPQGQPVTIDRVLADHAAISCDWAREPQAPATVKIAVDSKKLAGTSNLTSQVKVYVKQQIEPVIIPVSCTVR
jgi:hypothetical protein